MMKIKLCVRVSMGGQAPSIQVWKSIRALWLKLELIACVKVGNGRRTRFWREVCDGRQ